MSEAKDLKTFVWTEEQLFRAEDYQRKGQMRIVHQVRESDEDRYVCLVDCDARVNVFLHLL